MSPILVLILGILLSNENERPSTAPSLPSITIRPERKGRDIKVNICESFAQEPMWWNLSINP
jgi:hypothetical protein